MAKNACKMAAIALLSQFPALGPFNHALADWIIRANSWTIECVSITPDMTLRGLIGVFEDDLDAFAFVEEYIEAVLSMPPMERAEG